MDFPPKTQSARQASSFTTTAGITLSDTLLSALLSSDKGISPS